MQHAISAGHEKTLEVAKLILENGGNAFDAAIACHFAMFITEPCMASAGGAGFAMVKPHDQAPQFLDFFCQTPMVKHKKPTDFFEIMVDFGSEQEGFYIGLGSAAVPGTIAGLFELHRRYGSMPMKDLVSPAIAFANEGILLNTFQAYDLHLLKPIFYQDPKVREVFYNGEEIKIEGDLLQMPEMADFLHFLVDEGDRGFYQGDISRLVAEASEERGGFLNRQDFENYKVNVLEPFYFQFGDHNVYTANGPSKGAGLLAAFLYQMQNRTNQEFGFAIQEAQQLKKTEGAIQAFIDAKYPTSNYTLNPSNPSELGTSHFNIQDSKGNGICLTTTIGEGCGFFIPGTQMHLNNMLGEIFLLPNGAHSWTPNERMQSMMTPTLVLDKANELVGLFGSGGAGRIPYVIGQVLYHLLKDGLSIEAATEMPRVHFQDGFFQMEEGNEIMASLENLKVWGNKSLYFGGVHSIFTLDNKVMAYSDARRYGVHEIF